MKNISNRFLCWTGVVLIAVSVVCSLLVSTFEVSIDDTFRRVWEALTVLLGCGCFALVVTRKTYANRTKNASTAIYTLKLTGCVFMWFLIIQLTLSCF